MENIIADTSNAFDILMNQILPVIYSLIPTEVTEALSEFITTITPLWVQISETLSGLF